MKVRHSCNFDISIKATGLMSSLGTLRSMTSCSTVGTENVVDSTRFMFLLCTHTHTEKTNNFFFQTPDQNKSDPHQTFHLVFKGQRCRWTSHSPEPENQEGRVHTGLLCGCVAPRKLPLIIADPSVPFRSPQPPPTLFDMDRCESGSRH